MSENAFSPVVVVGAGLQGSCAALELARRGVEVTLLDQDEVAMNRASLRNEGKIHLGLIYAMDKSLATSRLQLSGALNFRRRMKSWIGPAVDELAVSTPFSYVVATDSLLTATDLSEHYARVEDIYRSETAKDGELDYFGARPERLARRLSADALNRHFDGNAFETGFETAEVAIDPAQLAAMVRDAIDHSGRVNFVGQCKVMSVERKNGRFTVEGAGPNGTLRMDAEQVVNATWERRRVLDDIVGLTNPEGWVHRLKYRVIARLPKHLRAAPSATMVLGRYGDVVVRPDGTAYLSWYPVGLQGWTHDIEPPEEWNGPCRGEVSEATFGRIAAGILEAIDTWFPGIGASTPLLVDAGAIVAYGQTDVDDESSDLHDRALSGVRSLDGFHSIDTGKLTTAPLFAVDVAGIVLAERG